MERERERGREKERDYQTYLHEKLRGERALDWRIRVDPNLIQRRSKVELLGRLQDEKVIWYFS